MKIRSTKTIVGIGIILIPSLIYSTALTTICIASLVILACASLWESRDASLVKTPVYLFLTLIFFNTLISGINSSDIESWLHGLNIKLPFLLMPIAFCVLPRMKRRDLVNLHLWYVVVMVICALPVLTQLLLHYSEYMAKLSQGQAIPTPVEHVKYSMLNAYALIACIYFISDGEMRGAIVRKVLVGACIFLFGFMHLLAVRTGLIIVYCSLPILLWHRVASPQRRAGLLVSMVLTILIAIATIPTLQTKIGYMVYDYQQYRAGRGHTYSDSERWLSNEVGWRVWTQSPIIGVGWGDLEDACILLYRQDTDTVSITKLPHSQYLTILARSGWLGLLLFLLGFYGSFLFYKGPHKLLLGLLLFNFSLSFLVENSIERSFMVAFFLFFALVIISTHQGALSKGAAA